MMIQTLAIIEDAYRELQSKKMFWIILILNIVAICAFALVGVSDKALTVAGKDFQTYQYSGFALIQYKGLFSTMVVGIWFTWIATLLALISTASIFPDFLSSGSIDLYLARPIGRLRLFLTKYIAGLAFVALQVSIFTVLSFFVLGMRAHSWQPGLFLAIPLVLLFFSYLYGIMVLLGTMTRSTVASLLLTLLIWFGIFAVDFVDRTISTVHEQSIIRTAFIDEATSQMDDKIADLKKDPEVIAWMATTAPSTAPATTTAATGPEAKQPTKARQMMDLAKERDELEAERDQFKISQGMLDFQSYVMMVKTPFPKTRETMNYLDRAIFTDEDMKAALRPVQQAAAKEGIDLDHPPARLQAAADELKKMHEERSALWVVGTSLLFEAVCVAIAAWFFVRRDY